MVFPYVLPQSHGDKLMQGTERLQSLRDRPMHVIKGLQLSLSNVVYATEVFHETLFSFFA